jgi:nuclear pore complex protein Nup205
MLTGLCTGRESAEHCFVMLKNNGQFYDNQSSKISWNHIFYAFERYYESFKPEIGQIGPQSNFTNQSLYIKSITNLELQALVSVIKLVNQIAYYSEKARTILYEYYIDEAFLNANNINNINNISHHPGFANMNASNYAFKANQSHLALAEGVANYNLNKQTLLAMLFGLLQSPIPVYLKGELLTLISSLSLTAKVAINVWNYLETSQIIQTNSILINSIYSFKSGPINVATFNKSDIRTEIEEIESREESYPFLRGFLTLLDNLLNVTNVPENLGVGIRSKNCILGFQPYLEFLINNVFLKIFYRQYKIVEEKWQIASLIMEIFYQLLSSYKVDGNDFQNYDFEMQSDIQKWILTKPSGFRLIYGLMNDGPLVRTLFLILNEALIHMGDLEKEKSVYVQNASLMCLKVIEITLNKQTEFLDFMKAKNFNIEMIGIEKVIITINPKTNITEYLFCILKYILFNSSLIEHAYTSLSILYQLSHYNLVNQKLLNLFLKSCLSVDEKFELMHAFVAFLDYDDGSETYADEGLWYSLRNSLKSVDNFEQGSIEKIILINTSNKDKLRVECRLKTLKFILFYLMLPMTNISHLLLGFDINKSLKNQSFYDAGTKISYSLKNTSVNSNNPTFSSIKTGQETLSIVPRNCLHSIIDLLNKYLKDPNLIRISQTIELCYEILLNLCSTNFYNQHLLDYLRCNHDFVYNHLKNMSFKENIKNGSSEYAKSNRSDTNETGEVHSRASIYSINALILNIGCIELKALLLNKNKSKLKDLVELFTKKADFLEKTNQNITDSSNILKLNESKSSFLHSKDPSQFFKSKIDLDLNSIVNYDDYENKFLSLLNALDLNISMPDQQLHLNYFEMAPIEKIIESCKAPTKKSYMNLKLFDLEKICQILLNEMAGADIGVSRINLAEELKLILCNIYERNAFEVKLSIQKKYLNSLKTMIEMIILLTPFDLFDLDSRYSIMLAICEVILTKIKTQNELNEFSLQLASFLFIIILNSRNLMEKASKSDLQLQAQKSNSIINQIFKDIVEFSTNSSLTNPKSRIYLYGCLINLLIIKDLKSGKTIEIGQDFLNQTGKGSILYLEGESFDVSSKAFQQLIKIVCNDAGEGSNILTMMGLSLINKILQIDSSQMHLKSIQENGFITCVANSLVEADSQLIEEFFILNKAKKITYIFEAKISLLITISKSSLGAEYLLRNGLINALSKCSIFSTRSKLERNTSTIQSFQYMNDILAQYKRLAFPIYNLIMCLNKSIGSKKQDAKMQSLKFILSHSESILHILTAKLGNMIMLEEVQLVTMILSELAPFEIFVNESFNSNIPSDFSSNLVRINKEVLSLIWIFFSSEQIKYLKKELENSIRSNKEAFSASFKLITTKIALDLSTYISKSAKDDESKMLSFVFNPQFKNSSPFQSM